MRAEKFGKEREEKDRTTKIQKRKGRDKATSYRDKQSKMRIDPKEGTRDCK